MRAPSTVVAFLLTMVVCRSAGLAKRFEDIDAKEIADTPIAKSLLQLGFVEEPVASGLYRAKITWAKAKEALAVKESDLFSIPNGPFGEWQMNVYIEGGFAHLSGKFEAGERGPIPAGAINVCANLGYARPSFLFVGMNTDRLEAALKFLGATNVTLTAADVLPEGASDESVRVIAAVLPDGKPIVATWKSVEWKPQEMPRVPVVSGFLVGEGTNGFKGWHPASAKKQETIPIRKYRVHDKPISEAPKVEASASNAPAQHPARP